MPWLLSYRFCLNMLPTKVISLRCYPHRGYSSCTYYTLTTTIYHWHSSSLQHLWVWCYLLNWHRDWMGGGTKSVLAIQGSRCTIVSPYHWWLCNPCNIPYISHIVACDRCSHSISAALLDPLALHFFTHDCNIHTIHPTLLTDWHPTFKQVISNWIDLGPNRDPGPFQSHFVSYHDLQVCYYSI